MIASLPATKVLKFALEKTTELEPKVIVFHKRMLHESLSHAQA